MIRSVRAIDGAHSCLMLSARRAGEIITMAVDCYVTVTFRDAGDNLATRRYLLLNQYADNGSDWNAAVTAAAALITGLDVLTMDHIDDHQLEFKITDSGSAANVAANNNVEAFTRCTTTASNFTRNFSVPAWDDVTFAKAANGLLSAAYQAAADTVAALIRDPLSGQAWTANWSQSRGLKRGQRLVK